MEAIAAGGAPDAGDIVEQTDQKLVIRKSYYDVGDEEPIQKATATFVKEADGWKLDALD